MAYNYLGDYMSFLYLFFIGIIIGSAMIVPGVSGAVIAVIFGLYDKMINSLTNLFKDFKKNFLFLSVLGSGILIGAIWFSNVLMFLYNKNEVVTKLSFIGFILGGVPFLFREVKLKKDRINYLVLFISFFISLILWIISKDSISSNFMSYSFINLFIAGIIYSVGKVVPGVSGSFLLIIIGMYNFILNVMAKPFSYGFKNILKVIPFILGTLIGALLLLKLMNYLFKKHLGMTYSIIIGFVLGSLLALVPTITFSYNLLYGIAISILCFILSYKLTK